MQEPNDDQGMILRWEDHIVPILEHPDIHIRDKTIVAVAWESCARPSELHQLSFGDVEDRSDHIAILASRRDGRERLLTLYRSMPYLKRWIRAEHPVTELLAGNADTLEEATPGTPVWTQTHTNKGISSAQLRFITKRVCERAEVPKEFTLYDIRRSRAKQLAAQIGLRNPALRGRFGWGPRKRNQFVDTVEDNDLNEDDKPRPPNQCLECGAWTPPHQPCLWCGTSR